MRLSTGQMGIYRRGVDLVQKCRTAALFYRSGTRLNPYRSSSLTARENLRFFGAMAGLKEEQIGLRTKNLLERVGLSDHAEDQVATYSGGMQRRLNLAAALSFAEAAVLDEPTVGIIDPQSRNHIYDTLLELNAAGMTILLSAHYGRSTAFMLRCDIGGQRRSNL